MNFLIILADNIFSTIFGTKSNKHLNSSSIATMQVALIWRVYLEAVAVALHV